MHEQTVIGVISIFSGDFAVVGEQVKNTVALTVENLSVQEDYRFVFEDGRCDKSLSLAAYEKLVAQGAQLIIAAGCSDTTLAIAPRANGDHVVVLMPSTGGENIDKAGEYVFRTGNSDIVAATSPAHDFIAAGYDKVALVTDQTEAMSDIRTHFIEAFTGEVILDEAVASDEVNLRTIIAKIQASNASLVFVNSQTGVSGAHFIRQAAEVGLSVPIVTNFNTATNTQSYAIAGDAMVGVYFYDPDYHEEDSRVQAFLSSYADRYGKRPSLAFHTLTTRDTLVMALEALEAVGNDGEAIHDYLLTKVRDWDGYTGRLSFDYQGNVALGYVLKRIVSQQGYTFASLSQTA